MDNSAVDVLEDKLAEYEAEVSQREAWLESARRSVEGHKTKLYDSRQRVNQVKAALRTLGVQHPGRS